MRNRRPLLTGAVAASLVTLAVAPATAQVPAERADYRAYSTGAVIHAEGLEQPTLSDPTSTRTVDADVAFSSAAVDSRGLPPEVRTAGGVAARTHNEFGAVVVPQETVDAGTAVAGNNAYGRGYGLDVSLGQTGQDVGQLNLAALVEAVAPPPSDPPPVEVGPVAVDPVAYASLLRGDASAIYDARGGCISLGDDLASGLGFAADAELVDTDLTPDDPAEDLETPLVSTEAQARNTSQSFSHDFLAPQVNAAGELVGDALGLVAETRQTIAPVTLFAGTPNQVTIELLGEWVLRAVATGVPGTAHVHYGPGEASPSTPALRIITVDEAGQEVVETELTTQDLLGNEGLVIDALPLLEIRVGEDPRAIGGDANSQPVVAPDGTQASAAVDAVLVRLLSAEGTGEVSEIRIGHMEAAAQVPAGGIRCDVPVTKTADVDSVSPGEQFTYTLTATNVFQCPLVDARFIDTIETTPGVEYEIVSTNPEGQIDGNRITIPVGDVQPGRTATATITIRVLETSAAGEFRNTAVFEGRCEGGPVSNRTDIRTAVDLTGVATINLPRVGPGRTLPATGDDLPATGGAPLALVGGLALLLGAVLRRR